MNNVNKNTIIIKLDPTIQSRAAEFKNAVFFERAYKITAVVVGILTAGAGLPLIMLLLSRADKHENIKNDLFGRVLRDINKDLARTGKIFIGDLEFSKAKFHETSNQVVDETWSEEALRTQFGMAQRVKAVLEFNFSETKSYLLLSNCMQGIYAPFMTQAWAVAKDAPEQDGVINMPRTNGSQEYRIEMRSGKPIVRTAVQDRILSLDLSVPNEVRESEAGEIRHARVSLVFDPTKRRLEATEDPKYVPPEEYTLPIDSHAEQLTDALAAEKARMRSTTPLEDL
ncbi:MAG TPA: hypothetical protein VGM34_00405 [Chlamydiales bacterium]